MSDEFDKGYFSYGPQATEEARRGQWARQEDERREREQRQREQSRREHDEAWQRHHRELTTASQGHLDARQWAPSSSGGSAEPATLSGCIKGVAVTGAVFLSLYAFGTGVAGWHLAVWAAVGAAAGAVAGVAVYAAIIILRIAVSVVAFLLKMAFWLAIVGGGLYLLAR